ncbi:MAG: rRNA maturation RNase YbeY [Bacteroidetes bacterium]|nr:rRNA maturation RNase YbeY [Bacteroidota bacterium]
MKNVFVNVEKGFTLNKRKVHQVLSLVCSELNVGISEMEINFVSSETMLAVNKKFLNHNYDTDIITFDYSNERDNLDGEIFISLAQAEKNGKLFRVSTDNELLRLIVHGVLHLIGYDDKIAARRKIMKKREDQLVKKFQKNVRSLIK